MRTTHHSFSCRKADGNVAERMAEDFFNSKGWKWLRTGYEYDTVRRHANAPDYAVLDPVRQTRCRVEVKASDAIAQDCYLHLCKLHEGEVPVNLLVLHEGRLHVIRLGDIIWDSYFRPWVTDHNGGSGKPWAKIDVVRTPKITLLQPT